MHGKEIKKKVVKNNIKNSILSYRTLQFYIEMN